MGHLAIVDAYQAFMATAQPLVDIQTDKQYAEALETLEEILESASDTPDDPLNPLIDMLSHAIERYEARDDELSRLIEEADSTDVDVALIRTLMRQYKLTGSDLPEIGDKTMVSRVLSGKRVLSRQAIERLSERFGLRPGMFFG